MQTNESPAERSDGRWARDGKSHANSSDNTPPAPSRQLLFNDRGQPVASMQDGILSKTARSSRHMLQHPAPAWALDAQHIAAAQAAGVHTLEIRDADTGACYTVDLAAFLEHARPLQRGYGLQWALPLGYWHTEYAPAVTAQPARVESPEPPAQLALWQDGPP